MTLYIPLTLILYIIALPIFLFSSFLMLLISLVNMQFFYISIKYFCRIILFSMGLCPKINGSFPKNNTFIIMMNHSSFLDIFLFPLFMQGLWSGVTAKENFQYPVLSAILQRLNAIAINRNNKKEALQSIRLAEIAIHDGYHIGILPEGSRTTTGKLGPLKKGGFHMAINTQTPILPIGISGAFSVKPKNRWWIKPGPITINIGKPIYISGENKNNINGLVKIVESKLKILSEEIYEH
jgi:1-acyl-sn-glycerol-3-phosphate acyltransferase